MANNKVLLLKDVDKLGRAGEIVSPRPGYFRNYLLPQGFAETATKQALRKQARILEERRLQAENDKAESEQIAATLVDIELVTHVKVDPEGHMYGSVAISDILHLLKEQAGIEVERRYIQLKHSIKQTGQHVVPLKLKEGVTSQIQLSILPEGSADKAI